MGRCTCVGVGPNGLFASPPAHLAGCPANGTYPFSDRVANLDEADAERDRVRLRKKAVAMTTQEDAPRTAAGKRLLDGFAPLPLPEAQELHRRSAMGRRVKVAAGILAIEQEAAQRALADVRWAVDVERLARAIIADGRLSHYLGDDWNAIVEAIAADYERLALLDTPPEGAETP